MTLHYIFIPEDLLSSELAVLFPLITNETFDLVLDSYEASDAQGRKIQIKKRWITFRVCESIQPFPQAILDQIRDTFNASMPEANKIPQSFNMSFTSAKELNQFMVEHETINPIYMNTEFNQVLRDKAFGQFLMNKFLALRKNQPSTAEQDLMLMDYQALGDVRELLYDGSIKSAWLRLGEKPAEVIPVELKEAFRSEMLTYMQQNGYSI